jgi:lipid A 3-O-deacylase
MRRLLDCTIWPLRNFLHFVFLSAALIAIVGNPRTARAGGLFSEVKIGILDHDVPDLWSGFRREEESADINLEALLSPSVMFFGGTIRPAIGASVNTSGQTSHAYLDARWQYETPAGIFFGLGLGGAIHNGELDDHDPDRKALGSRLLFHIPIEVGYRFDEHNSVSMYFEHTSNGYTQDFNEGLDRLGIRYGYHF